MILLKRGLSCAMVVSSSILMNDSYNSRPTTPRIPDLT
jgi:hypothetical protein